TLVQERSGYALEPWKPLTGENLFTRESGAVAAQFHDPPAIEPYSSELVGAPRGIVLGKKSGIDSIRIKVAELGLDVPEDRFAALLAAVKRLRGDRRGRLRRARVVRRGGGEGGGGGPPPRVRPPADGATPGGGQPRRAARPSTGT